MHPGGAAGGLGAGAPREVKSGMTRRIYYAHIQSTVTYLFLEKRVSHTESQKHQGAQMYVL